MQQHIKAGLKAFSTPEAACTFYDDMAEVEKLGVTLVSADEASKLKDVDHIELRDLHLDTIRTTLRAFGIDTHFDAVAVAVLDHGAAPRGVSDRIFRFQHLERSIRNSGRLESFVYLSTDIPPYLTRMKAVADTMDSDAPLVLLDTGAAAALGALKDKGVNKHDDLIVINMGNFHTLAFYLHQKSIMGLFEHHTGRMNPEKIDNLLKQFASCQLTNEAVFADGGHGCVPLSYSDEPMPFIVATGPRRGIMSASALNPYMAAPYGDMMLTGCYGLIYGVAVRIKEWQDEIVTTLEG